MAIPTTTDQEAADYMLGYSSTEARRLDYQHAFIRHAIKDGLLASSLEQPLKAGEIKRILDVGTGTGIWCSDAAAEMKAMGVPGPLTFVGTDVIENERWPHHRTCTSTVNKGEVPYANIVFEMVDLNDDVAMTALVEKYGGLFDLIHSRLLLTAVKDGKWVAYLERLFKLLRPGGYFQAVEVDPMNAQSCGVDQASAEFVIICYAVYRGQGLDVEAAFHLAHRLRLVGFVNVRDLTSFCNACTRRSDGALQVDPIIQQWLVSVFKTLKPLFLKLRPLPHYQELLRGLPLRVYRNSPGGRPELLLKDEAEYDDFEKRHQESVLHQPLNHTIFRVITGQRPM